MSWSISVRRSSARLVFAVVAHQTINRVCSLSPRGIDRAAVGVPVRPMRSVEGTNAGSRAGSSTTASAS